MEDNWLDVEGGRYVCEMLTENCYITDLVNLLLNYYFIKITFITIIKIMIIIITTIIVKITTMIIITIIIVVMIMMIIVNVM